MEGWTLPECCGWQCCGIARVAGVTVSSMGKSCYLHWLERGSTPLVHVPGKAVKPVTEGFHQCLALSHWHLVFSLLVVTPVTPVLGKGFCGTEGALFPLHANSGTETCSERSTAGSSSAACEQPEKQKSFKRMLFILLLPSWQLIQTGRTVDSFLQGLTSSWALPLEPFQPSPLREAQRRQMCWECPWGGWRQQGSGSNQQLGSPAQLWSCRAWPGPGFGKGSKETQLTAHAQEFSWLQLPLHTLCSTSPDTPKLAGG